MAPEMQNWDSGGNWDQGFQWDVNLPPSLGDITPYLKLITSEHRDKPNYIAFLSAVLQPFVDNLALIASMPALFDIDVAVGDQLDKTGQWIGRTRFLSVPLDNVYFSLDVDGLGFDEGVWQGRFDPNTGLVELPDDSYRILLKATIAANQWDGTIPSAYLIWNILFGSEGISILIFDNQDMTMEIGIAGNIPDAVTLALLTGGYLALRPAGVEITGYWLPTEPGPLFGFDVENSAIAGFDNGSWAAFLPPT